MSTDIYQEDEAFVARGATHYHDSMYPPQGRHWSIERRTYVPTASLFSRHYFNAEGTEIGLVIPDLFSVGMGVQVFDKPRVWGIDHTLIPIRGLTSTL